MLLWGHCLLNSYALLSVGAITPDVMYSTYDVGIRVSSYNNNLGDNHESLFIMS